MKKLVLCSLLFVAVAMYAEAPAGYYAAAEGKTNTTLRTALAGVIDGHTVISYKNLEEYYPSIDARIDNPNRVWDIYSTCEFSFNDANCSQKKVCDCWNKEHTVPQSWFSKASPMKSDLYHVLPTDARVNNFRGNLPYGEVSDHSSPVCGDSHALGWRSNNVAFEPVDEFKGDIARIYFYMATRYADKCSSWSGGMFGSGNNGFVSSVATMLLKWHRNDPVSEKETLRNDAVYKYQKNRNPFVDYPELAEYIWGNKKGEAWYSGEMPVKTKTVTFRELAIYPNPATDFVTITTEVPEMHYAIVSLSGQMLAQGTVASGESLSLGDLANGMYLLRLQADGKTQVTKIVVNK
ncbi:MAG: endonuclease [Bacteroidales bacterium]|nr:endonuclease [Bacteroidales bacterium]